MYNRHIHNKLKKRKQEKRKQEHIEKLNKKRRKAFANRYMDRMQQWFLQSINDSPRDEDEFSPTEEEESLHDDPFTLTFNNIPEKERVSRNIQDQQKAHLEREPIEFNERFTLRERNSSLEIQPRRMRFDKWRSDTERLIQHEIIVHAKDCDLIPQKKKAFRRKLLKEADSHGKPLKFREQDPNKSIAGSFKTMSTAPAFGTEPVQRISNQDEYEEKACMSMYGMSKRFDPRFPGSTTTVRRNSSSGLASNRSSLLHEKKHSVRPSTQGSSRGSLFKQDTLHSASSHAAAWSRPSTRSMRSLPRTPGSEMSRTSARSTRSEKSYDRTLQDLYHRSTAQRPVSSAVNSLFSHDENVSNAKHVLKRRGVERKKKKRVGMQRRAKRGKLPVLEKY